MVLVCLPKKSITLPQQGSLSSLALSSVRFYVNYNTMENFWWTFSSSFDMIILCRKAVHVWDCIQKKDSMLRVVLKMLETLSLAISTFLFAFGGMIVGGVAGSMKGQTTETGLCRGAAVGAMSGAIVALELLDSMFNGHFLSKVALFGSIFDGKAFREWVSPAVLKAYQWQTSTNERVEATVSDIYNIAEIRGVSPELINNLPVINFLRDASVSTLHTEVCCSICLQDVVEGERAKMLPKCEHLFHAECIDQWLARSTSCPVCRKTIYSEEYWGYIQTQV